MALIGGGGAPNVAGAGAPLGTGSTLNTIGDFAYAYTGLQNATDAGATFLDFTTGQYLFVGNLQVLTADQSGNEIKATVRLNGVNAVEQTYRNDGNGPAGIFPLDLIIPAETRVEIIMTNASGGGDKVYSVAMVGRIYA
tara:strand:+ start:37 stop:453 length:417 start_codon:yes stop_codon:yes gene_type:complete